MLITLIITLCLSANGQSKTLEFIETIEDDSIHLDLRNYLFGPVHIKIQYKGDFQKTIIGPREIVIGSNECIPAVISISKKVVIDTASFTWKDYLDVEATLGDPYNSSHDDSEIYDLPFMKNKSYKILQAWDGKFSHQSMESKYALDFTMPEGDTICAARAGIVIRTVDHYTENGGKELRDQANQIVILHEDGTMAFYVHLIHEGVLVEVGDTISKGQIIGLSGNTGYSTIPHLHFVVREAPDRSVPVYFQEYYGKRFRKGDRIIHRSE